MIHFGPIIARLAAVADAEVLACQSLQETGAVTYNAALVAAASSAEAAATASIPLITAAAAAQVAADATAAASLAVITGSETANQAGESGASVGNVA